MDLDPRSNEYSIWIAPRRGDNVCTACDRVRRNPVKRRYRLTAQDDRNRSTRAQREHPCLCYLSGVAGPNRVQPADRPQRGEMLECVMGRAILGAVEAIMAQ